MADKREKMMNKEVSEEVAAFQADLELARYCHRVETGDLTDEEEEDRKAILDFLGYSDPNESGRLVGDALEGK